MNTTLTTNINRKGYLATHQDGAGTRRTYACSNKAALDALIFYLTGREAETFPLDRRGLPAVKEIIIAHPIHIWGVSTGESAVISGKEDAFIPDAAILEARLKSPGCS